jgi:hypothetical protein
MARQAALRPRKKKTISRVLAMNLSKGLNNLVSSSLIDNREFSEMLNIEYDEGGVARKRAGFVAVGTALTAAKGLGVLKTESLNWLCTIDGTVFKYLTAGVWTTVSGATYTSGSEVVFTQARNKIYVWNGVEGGSSWDGTTLTRPGTMPKGKFALFSNNVHLVAGVDGQRNRLYVSANDDSSMFTRNTLILMDATEVPGATVFTDATAPQAYFIDVRKDDGDQITGLARYANTVIIFKRRSIYQLDFDSSGQPVITPITSATGCLSHKSIDSVENDVYFLSPEGIRVLGNEANYDTAIRTNVLSIRIQNTIDSINPQYQTKCNALYYNNKYMLAIPTNSGDGNISKVITYDKRFAGYSLWDTIIPNSMVEYVDSTNTSHFYWMSDSGTQMYEVEQGRYNDNGAAIDAYVVSKAQDFGNIDITKRFVDLGLAFRRLSGLISVTIYLDDNSSAGTVVLGSSGGTSGMGLGMFGTEMLGTAGATSTSSASTSDTVLRVVVNQSSRSLKFKIQNSRVDENFVFLGCIYGFYPRSHFNFDSANKIYI